MLKNKLFESVYQNPYEVITSLNMHKRLIIPLLIVLPLTGPLFSQKFDDLFLLYENRKIERLQSRLSELEKRNPNEPEILFFRTVFTESGDDAIIIYQELYKTARGALKSLVARKLSDYYFAQGYYIKALEFRKEAEQNYELKIKESSTVADNDEVGMSETASLPKYIIQVGAFGVRQNADDLAEILQRNKVNAEVVQREINDNILYCVWIQGDPDYAVTKKYAEKIKSDYKLTYRILKP